MIGKFEKRIKDLISDLKFEFVGQEAEIIKDFRDQPVGISKPNLKGRKVRITGLFLDNERVWFQVVLSPSNQDVRCYLRSDQLQLLEG